METKFHCNEVQPISDSRQKARNQLGQNQQMQTPPSLAARNRRSENVGVLSVVVSERKLRDIRRHVFLADLVSPPSVGMNVPWQKPSLPLASDHLTRRPTARR